MPVRSTRESVKNAIRTRWLRARKADVVDVEGVRLALDGAWATPLVRKALYSRWYEDAELRILAERLRPDDRVLEVGTGLGVVTTAACRIVGPEAVVSYDANPEIVAVARATAAANGFTPKIVHGVLGDESGETTFYLHSDFWTSSLEPNADARPVTVPKLSLDAEIAVHRPSFLMLDMEGGEIELLDGYELPAYVRAICMETHPQATGTAALQALLSHLIAQGFALDLGISGEDIAYFERTA